MSGNVWEWCEDDWHSNYTGAPANGIAWIDSPRGLRRVARGGGWYNSGIGCRSAHRYESPPSLRDINMGFRLCR